MEIKDLKTRQGNVEVQGVIKEIEEPRIFNKFGRELKVANAILEDASGFVKLTLWNDDIDNFKIGDIIKIINGYVNEFQGEKQLTSGKFGKIEKIGEGEVSESKKPKKQKLLEIEESEEEVESGDSEEEVEESDESEDEEEEPEEEPQEDY